MVYLLEGYLLLATTTSEKEHHMNDKWIEELISLLKEETPPLRCIDIDNTISNLAEDRGSVLPSLTLVKGNNNDQETILQSKRTDLPHR